MFQAVTEANIRVLVETFYGRVRKDDVLGPIFNAHIADWEPHFQTLTRFWCSVMLADGGYKGDPLGSHKDVPGIAEELFSRWLSLFEHTTSDLYHPDLAAAFLQRAQRMSKSLVAGMFYRPENVDGQALP